eukprot:12748137-Ditylum_brightwellii.AAC.1
MFDEVTAIANSDWQFRLFGVRRRAYYPTLTDDEVVVNTYLIQEVGWPSDCVAKRHGGSQCFWFLNGNDIPLE